MTLQFRDGDGGKEFHAVEQKRQGTVHVRGRGPRCVFLPYNVIDGLVVNRLSTEVMRLYALDPRKSIHLFLRTAGGETNSALFFWYLIKENNIVLDVTVLGKAHSAGIIILCAGRRRYAVRPSGFFLHPSSIPIHHARMERKHLREEDKFMGEEEAVYVEILARTTGQSLGAIRRFMQNHTYWDAEAAKANGLIHRVKPIL